MHFFKIIGCALLALFVVSCAQPQGNTPEDKRNSVLAMKNDTLNILYAKMPAARAKVQNAAGYAVFSDIGMHLWLLGHDNGYGVLVDNATQKQTFMRMSELEAGLGLGLKNFRVVFIFNNQHVLNQFVNSGWEFGSEAEATAKSKGKGVSGGGESYGKSNIQIYRITESGVALQAALEGTKYWKDKELN